MPSFQPVRYLIRIGVDSDAKVLGQDRNVIPFRLTDGLVAADCHPSDISAFCHRLSGPDLQRLPYEREQIQAVWDLCGARTETILSEARGGDAAFLRHGSDNLADSRLPRPFVRHVLRREWVTRLSDLVERRLMLLYDQQLSLACLCELAELMVEGGLLTTSQVTEEVEACRQRLLRHFGKAVRTTDHRIERQKQPGNGGS